MGRAFEYRRAAKEKRWSKMSKIFPKLAKAITLATKQGGGDPDMNARLRAAIANAKSQNMPKDNIETAIKRASGKDGVFEEITYEGRAIGGVLLFIECASDNPTRTVANIKSYFNKSGATLLSNGSLDFMFSHKGEFVLHLSDSIDRDSVELELIDFGLESLEILECEDASLDSESGDYVAYCKYEDFGNLQNGLEKYNLQKCGIEVKSAKLVRIPTSPITLSEEQIVELDKLLDRIEEDDDVQAVYTNVR